MKLFLPTVTAVELMLLYISSYAAVCAEVQANDTIPSNGTSNLLSQIKSIPPNILGYGLFDFVVDFIQYYYPALDDEISHKDPTQCKPANPINSVASDSNFPSTETSMGKSSYIIDCPGSITALASIGSHFGIPESQVTRCSVASPNHPFHTQYDFQYLISWFGVILEAGIQVGFLVVSAAMLLAAFRLLSGIWSKLWSQLEPKRAPSYPIVKSQPKKISDARTTIPDDGGFALRREMRIAFGVSNKPTFRS